MLDVSEDQAIELDIRKEQALQLNIDIEDEITLESIEEEISIKLENGMKDLKTILDEISHLDS